MGYPKQSRRGFIKNLAAAPIGIFALAPGRKAMAGTMQSALVSALPFLKSEVVVATRNSAADRNGTPNGGEVLGLLNDSIVAATGKSEPRASWRSLFGPKDIVGIKVNCLAGYGLSTHAELVAAIVHGLESAGVPRNNIIVWDRAERELAAVGFTSAGVNGARVLATDSRGVGYERDIEFSGDVGSCFSKIISRMCTAIINVPVLKDHDLSGVSLGMKNFYGVIHNPNKYHDNNCNPYIADLCAHPLIAKKLRLVICDGLKGQYHGGPAFRPQWSWPAATLLVGNDPVAVDRVGLEIIEEKRREMGMASLKDSGRGADYIETASRRGLGIAQIEKISKIIVS